ncbi:hypothetical protein ACJ72_07586 [Emergomyces africanus]|uniref:BRCA1-associated 2/ETP1 RRM domain-containing protein n=1 Tax=Emergomyces africanus TaxID=1955775 RepID=A0A1B7NNC8_9EURO|nr:hypothetical protein ACJ72_07586 [Emergomyces africanus]
MPSYFYHILLELIAGGSARDEHLQIHDSNSRPHPHSPSNSHSHSHLSQSPLDRSDSSIITLQAFSKALQPFRNKKRARGAGRGLRGDNRHSPNNNNNTSSRYLERKDNRGNSRNGNSGNSRAGGEIYREFAVLGSNSGSEGNSGVKDSGKHTNGLLKCRASLGASTPTTTATNISTATARSPPSKTAGVVQQEIDESLANSTSSTTAASFSKLAYDKRVDQISIESIDMVVPEQNQNLKQTQAQNQQQQTETDEQHQQHQQQSKGSNNSNQIAKGIGTSVIGGLATKGKYVPLDQKASDSAWGIVHLYRDIEETSALYKDDDDPSFLKGSALARSAMIDGSNNNNVDRKYGSADVLAEEGEAGESGGSGSSATTAAHSTEDCTTLCILAVPSYMSPSDFLGFVGEQTRDEVSHFRMIRTARANRYMVLMKFRNGKRAKEWQRDWNGKVFNSMEVSRFY